MSLAYFPLYPDDFEADTAHLTLAEDGAYNRLLRLCWRTPGCSLPADRTWIHRRMRAHTEADKAVVDTVLDEFFALRDGRVSNARLAKEWRIANESHKRRVEAGAKGGKAKALKDSDSAPSNAEAKPKQPEPEPEPEYKKEDTNVSLSGEPDAPVHASPASEAVAAYNRAAEAAGWPKVQRMTPQRARSLRARLAECGGIDGWEVALRRAMDSDFLCGRTPKPWTGFGFDWLTKAANFTKLMEGNYENRGNHRAAADDPALRAIAAAARAF
jgi:uncharacterized protein YdaU (DUF1376 family)